MPNLKFNSLLTVSNILLVVVLLLFFIQNRRMQEQLSVQNKLLDSIVKLNHQGAERDSMLFAMLDEQMVRIDTVQINMDSKVEDLEQNQKQIKYLVANTNSSLVKVEDELNRATSNSEEQEQILQKQLNTNEALLKRQIKPKLFIENIDGKAEFKNGRWVTQYRFELKNYGGDIYNLSLKHVAVKSDTLGSITFPIPSNGYLPYQGKIDVQTSSFELNKNIHQIYLHYRDRLKTEYKQKLVFSKNKKGFRFDLDEMEEVQ